MSPRIVRKFILNPVEDNRSAPTRNLNSQHKNGNKKRKLLPKKKKISLHERHK